MAHTLAQTDPVFLMSWWKPILFLIVLVGWAWVAAHLSKDAGYYYLKQNWLNLGQMAVGVVGFGLMLLVPIFLLGLMLGVLVLAGGVLGYAMYRNQRVPEEARWTFSLDSLTQRLDAKQRERAQRQATMALMTAKEKRLDVPTGDHADVPAHTLLENVLEFALPRRAERVEMAVSGSKAAIFVKIDGIRYPQPEVEPQLALQLVDYLKHAAELDVEDRRKKQTATLRVDAGELGRHRLDLETAGSTRGLTLSLVIDPAQRVHVPFADLGLLEGQRQQLQQVIESTGKVVLLATPPGHGTTTSFYSLLQEHDPYTSSVIMLQDEIPFEVEGISHNLTAEGATPKQINEQLAALLRSDPNVVGLPRLADTQTARIVAESAEEVRFYIALPAPETFTAVKTWLKLVGDKQLGAESLGAVLSQRLVRRLCPTCRTAYTPDPAALKKLNLPADRVSQFYQASGQVIIKDKPQPCPLCHGVGYRGRVGVFEVMVLDDPARSLLAAGDFDRLRAHLRKQKMLWLQEAALAKVVEGVTDIKEVTRTLAESAGDRSSASAAPSPAKT